MHAHMGIAHVTNRDHSWYHRLGSMLLNQWYRSQFWKKNGWSFRVLDQQLTSVAQKIVAGNGSVDHFPILTMPNDVGSVLKWLLFPWFLVFCMVDKLILPPFSKSYTLTHRSVIDLRSCRSWLLPSFLTLLYDTFFWQFTPSECNLHSCYQLKHTPL